MHLVLFLVFAALAVGAAINLLIQRHPIHSALSLVVVMGSLAVEYLLLGAEFIAFIQVIVYAGAIMVLFVFVIMVLNAGETERSPGSRVAEWIGYPVVALLLVEIGGQLYRQFRPAQVGFEDYVIHAADIGNSLFHEFLLPFEVTSVLFLVGILGAVVLAARKEEAPKAAQAKARAAGGGK